MNVGHTILKQRWADIRMDSATGAQMRQGSATNPPTGNSNTIGNSDSGNSDNSDPSNNPNYEMLGLPIRSGLHRISASAGEFKDSLEKNLGNEAVLSLSHSTRKQRCFSCYGALPDEDSCCNTCQSLRTAFRQKGWQFPEDHIPEQCQEELFTQHPPRQKEGCKLSSRSISRKVPAYIQIGLANDFRRENLVESFIDRAKQGYISFSHTIENLNFGPDFPGFIKILDGIQRRHEHGILTIF